MERAPTWAGLGRPAGGFALNLPWRWPRSAWLIGGLVLAVTLFGLALRLYQLGQLSVTGDEEFSVRIARDSLGEMFQRISREAEPHPPLYYLLLHGWIRIAGQSDLMIRLPSAVISAAAIPLVFRLGHRLAGLTVGSLAALLFAASPFETFYAQQARMYSLGVTLTIAATIAFLEWRERVLRDQGARHWAVAYVVAATLALYTHYYTGLLLAALQAWAVAAWWLAAERRRRADLFRWIGLHLVIAALFAPWLIVATGVIARYGALGGQNPTDPVRAAVRLLPAFAGGWSLPADPRSVLGLLGTAGALLGAAFLLKRRPASAAVLLTLFVLPAAFLVPFSYVRTDFNERYVAFSLPAFLILLAAGITAPARLPAARPAKLLGGLIGGLVLLACLAAGVQAMRNRHSDPAFMNGELRPLAFDLAGQARPDDAVVFEPDGNERLFNHYYPGPALAHYRMPPTAPAEASSVDQTLRRVAEQHPRLWFVVDHHDLVDPGHLVESWLERNLARASSRWHGTVRLALYHAVEPDRTDQTSWRITPGAEQRDGGSGRGEIREWAWRSQVEAGDAVTLRVRLAPQEMAPSWRVAGNLSDAEGHLIEHLDVPLAGEFPSPEAWLAGLDRRFGLVVPPGTVPGLYRLTLWLYDADTGRPLLLRRGGTDNPVVGLPPVEVRVERPAAVPAYHGEVVGTTPRSVVRSLSAANGVAKPGQSVVARVEYHQTGPEPPEVRISLLDAAGHPVARSGAGVAERLWPAEQRRPGEPIGEAIDVIVPPTAPTGTYRLEATIDGQAFPIGEIPVVSRPRIMEAPPTTSPRDDRFADGIGLVGADRRVEAGALILDLHWTASQTPSRDWTVFTHLLDPAGRVVAQHDGPPVDGNVPTGGWPPGEYVTDRHVLPLPGDLPPGHYPIEIGLYDNRTGERLPLLSGATFLLLDPLVWPAG